MLSNPTTLLASSHQWIIMDWKWNLSSDSQRRDENTNERYPSLPRSEPVYSVPPLMPRSRRSIDSNASGETNHPFYYSETTFADDSYSSFSTDSTLSCGANSLRPDGLYPQYLPESDALDLNPRTTSQKIRPTPSSLGWSDSSFLVLYKFVVPKGREPFFDLLSGNFATADTPTTVYLDFPK